MGWPKPAIRVRLLPKAKRRKKYGPENYNIRSLLSTTRVLRLSDPYQSLLVGCIGHFLQAKALICTQSDRTRTNDELVGFFLYPLQRRRFKQKRGVRLADPSGYGALAGAWIQRILCGPPKPNWLREKVRRKILNARHRENCTEDTSAPTANQEDPQEAKHDLINRLVDELCPTDLSITLADPGKSSKNTPRVDNSDEALTLRSTTLSASISLLDLDEGRPDESPSGKREIAPQDRRQYLVKFRKCLLEHESEEKRKPCVNEKAQKEPKSDDIEQDPLLIKKRHQEQQPEPEPEQQHDTEVAECMTDNKEKKILIDFLSRQRSPWLSESRTMDGRGLDGQIRFGVRAYSRASQLGSLPLPEADTSSVISTGVASEYCARYSRGTGQTQLCQPQSHAPLPRRTPQPQLMLPLRDKKLGRASRQSDDTKGEEFYLEGEQLIKPKGRKASDQKASRRPQISGYYRDALLRKGATLRPIAAGSFTSRLALNTPTDIRAMTMHMSAVSDFVATDFGLNPERTKQNAGLSTQKFVRRADLFDDVALTADKHIYVAQNSHMFNRNSRVNDGIQNVRKTLYPFMEQERPPGRPMGRVPKETPTNADDRPMNAGRKSEKDLPIYERQLWKRQTQQPKHYQRQQRKPPIVLPPIDVCKVSLAKEADQR